MNPNNYATLEAAQRLLDAGIVLETDFCSDLWGDPNKIIPWYSGVEPGHPDFVPRPSMAEVWRELPETIQTGPVTWKHLTTEKMGTRMEAYYRPCNNKEIKSSENPIDALIDLLIWVKAQKEGVCQ
jgi:hypothetical protein